MLIFFLYAFGKYAEDEMNQIMDEQMEKRHIGAVTSLSKFKGIFSDIIPEFNLQDSAASIAKAISNGISAE